MNPHCVQTNMQDYEANLCTTEYVGRKLEIASMIPAITWILTGHMCKKFRITMKDVLIGAGEVA